MVPVVDPQSAEPIALLSHPACLDIVISDFGRESAVAYVAEVAQYEREMIQALLAASGGLWAYYDEYRRIMFDLLGDLSYFKAPLICDHQIAGGLTADVLLGVGGAPIPSEIRDRICNTMLIAAWHGLNRDSARRVRLVIPCNTLSSLGDHLRMTVEDASRLHWQLSQTAALSWSIPSVVQALTHARIDVFTVPRVVLAAVARTTQGESLLVLGTSTAIELYQQEVALRGEGAVIESLSSEEQELIDRAIGAALSQERDAIADVRDTIAQRIVEPRLRRTGGRLTVVEACTDLDMSLGLNSREVFARSLVDDAYAGLESVDA